MAIKKAMGCDNPNYVLTLRGRYMDEEFLVMTHQTKGGLIMVFGTEITKDGISSELMLLDTVMADHYHCDKCRALINKDTIETACRKFCELNQASANEQEFEEGSYYSFVSLV